jgi:cell fate regulator YaaT (PSP1 superfamily)
MSKRNGDGPRKIVNVRFREDGKWYEFYTGHFVLKEGDQVIVQTQKGQELGTVCSKPRLRDSSMPTRPIKKIFRLATTEDIEQKRKNEQDEAEVAFDRSKMTFYYTSKTRVDFRELVKDLVQRFHTHVEMRQIGTRDLARMLSGVGHCGRELCCSVFLSNFDPISIRMAKEQELSLNPTKISGICGRLMCCLAFEYDDYSKTRKARGKNGKK